MRVLVLFAALCAMPLCAATLTVTNLNDAGAGSLRATITAAVTGDEIVFDASLAGGTLTLITGQIAPGGKVLTITGLTTAGGKPDITISGNDSSRIFNHTAALTLNNLRLLDGHMTAGGGGAITNNGSVVLTCTNCVFESCRTSSTSAMGGAIKGRIGTLTDCAFIGNSTPSTHGGGALSVGNASSQIVRCSFEGNSSGLGGAIYFEAGGSATLQIENSTFSGNQSTGSGGGAILATVLVFTGSATLTVDIANCTFADNSCATAGGGQCVRLVADNAGGTAATVNATSNSCIFTDNLATAMFVATTSGSNATATFSSTGYNLCSDAPAWMYVAGDQINANAQLLPMADNGGLTRTHAFDPGSPVLDTGDPAGTLTEDQRALPRDASPDIGAFEYQKPGLAVTYGGVPVVDGGYAALANLSEVGMPLTETCVFANNAATQVDLTMTVPISISGEVNCTATVTTQPAATLAQGASSNVVFSITPTAEGLFSFTVTVASNTVDGSYTYDVFGYAVASGGGGGGGGGGGDDDSSCSTGTSRGYPLALGLAVLVLGLRRRVRGLLAR